VAFVAVVVVWAAERRRRWVEELASFHPRAIPTREKWTPLLHRAAPVLRETLADRTLDGETPAGRTLEGETLAGRTMFG